MLIERGAAVTVYDPQATDNSRQEIPSAMFADDPYAVAKDADVLVLLTEWDEFKWLDYGRVLELMRHPIIVDTRNCLDPAVLRKLGFTYEGVGR
jgi:UDPglucose 6-dehydrogenase